MKILISCGEPSGDMYAGALAREIRALDRSADIFGMGGNWFHEGGGRLEVDYRGLSVTGLSEALGVIPRSLMLYRRLVKLAKAERPDVFVPIDFPDFNFRLANTFKRLGIPVVYYVCPQVWAWRRSRLISIKRFATQALVIFKFEEEIYREVGVPVQFVGHPLIDICQLEPRRDVIHRAINFDPTKPTVALFPGSRPNEVRAILPDLVKAASLIALRLPGVQFLIARAPNLDDNIFDSLSDLSDRSHAVAIFEGRSEEVLSSCDVVVTASGTATVQTAIHGRPMVIVYRLSPLTYRLVRKFIHVDTVGMVNLIAGEKFFPELIQDEFTPSAVADEVLKFFENNTYSQEAREKLKQLRVTLGKPGASRRAAEAILSVAKAKKCDSTV